MQEFEKTKKRHGSGTTTLIISNEEMNDIMKIVQALEDSGVLLKGVTKIIKNETKEQNEGFLSMLLDTLGAILLADLLTGKGILRAGPGNKKGKRNCKSWYRKTMGFLMPLHPLTNFQIQKYYQSEPRFYGIFWRNNLPKKIKDRTCILNLDEYVDLGAHWIALFSNRNEIACFDSFGVEHIPEEIKKFIRNKDMKANIFQGSMIQ